MGLLLLGRPDDRRELDRLHAHGVALGALLEVAREPAKMAVRCGSAAQAPPPAGHAPPARQPGVGLMGIAEQSTRRRQQAVYDDERGDEAQQEAYDAVQHEGDGSERDEHGQRPDPHAGRPDGPLHNICIPLRRSSTGP